MRRESLTGFSFIELVVAIGIVGILGAIALPVSHSLREDTSLNNTAKEVVALLQLAQSKTLASEGLDSWGILFQTGQYTLFKGPSFSLRTASLDEVHTIPNAVEFFNIGFSQGEVLFAKLTGLPSSPGSVTLRLKEQPAKTKTVFLGSSGEINVSAPGTLPDTQRVKDSRHVHVSYAGRTINTANEILRITFPNEGNPVTQDIVIANNMVQGQLLWEGKITVAGAMQDLKLGSHLLNDATLGTSFSIHRDRMKNTKGFFLQLTGDTSGTIITYNDAGLTTQGTSIYASQPQIQ